jgi:hypothetical protein
MKLVGVKTDKIKKTLKRFKKLGGRKWFLITTH